MLGRLVGLLLVMTCLVLAACQHNLDTLGRPCARNSDCDTGQFCAPDSRCARITDAAPPDSTPVDSAPGDSEPDQTPPVPGVVVLQQGGFSASGLTGFTVVLSEGAFETAGRQCNAAAGVCLVQGGISP